MEIKVKKRVAGQLYVTTIESDTYTELSGLTQEEIAEFLTKWDGVELYDLTRSGYSHDYDCLGDELDDSPVDELSEVDESVEEGQIVVEFL